MHDGTVTTLRKEAEKLNISPEEYAKTFEETIGDCPSDKIETIDYYKTKEFKLKEEIATINAKINSFN